MKPKIQSKPSVSAFSMYSTMNSKSKSATAVNGVKSVSKKNSKSKKTGNGRKTNLLNGNGVQKSKDQVKPKQKLKKKKPSKKLKETVVKTLNSEPSTSGMKPSKNKSASQTQQSVTPISNSIVDGKDRFSWLINPESIDSFMTNNWERKPLLIARKCPNYFRSLLSCQAIDRMLRENYVEYTKNIDITSYRDGQRETHNPEGRALPPSVWKSYQDGCSVRILNPQTFLPEIHRMNSILQEYFHTMCGANVYLTPPNSQGFAPHYDDIEAFVLQVEGRKNWKLYKPIGRDQYLPRVSSGNFQQSEIGTPILNVILEPGDMLYFPRGTIHQANTVSGHHSLHITVSVYQRNSYGDLFEKLIPLVLKRAIQSNIEFRRGLPLNIWQSFGLLRSNSTDAEANRDDIYKTIKELMDMLGKTDLSLDLDYAVDQTALQYQHDALPPHLTETERLETVFGTKIQINEESGEVEPFKISDKGKVRLIRANILRVVYGDSEDVLRLYYYSDNSKEYHEYEQNYLEIDRDSVDLIEQLIKSYPKYIPINESQADVVQELWDRGLLMATK